MFPKKLLLAKLSPLQEKLCLINDYSTRQAVLMQGLEKKMITTYMISLSLLIEPLHLSIKTSKKFLKKMRMYLRCLTLRQKTEEM